MREIALVARRCNCRRLYRSHFYVSVSDKQGQTLYHHKKDGKENEEKKHSEDC